MKSPSAPGFVPIPKDALIRTIYETALPGKTRYYHFALLLGVIFTLRLQGMEGFILFGLGALLGYAFFAPAATRIMWNSTHGDYEKSHLAFALGLWFSVFGYLAVVVMEFFLRTGNEIYTDFPPISKK